MAEAITSSNATNSNTGEQSYYAKLNPLSRAEAALEMASEIKETLAQHYALASVISSTLAPPQPGRDSADWAAYRLAQLLESSMEDFGQICRLVDCLTASRDVLAVEGAKA